MKNESFRWQVGANIIMAAAALCALLPFVLLIIASFTDNSWVVAHGFSFFPEQWSLNAYEYIINQWRTIGRAYLMTIVVTAAGTAGSVIVTTMFAHALTNDQLPGGRLLNMMCVFTMLFSGGIVSSFYCWVNIFHIRNTLWALVFPNLFMNAFNVILVKNYLKWSIPSELKEAARIDGAGELRVFTQILLPLCKPILATIGLTIGLMYWNDWTNGLYYLTQRNGSKYYTIQLILNTINENLNFLLTSGEGLGAIDISTMPSLTVRMAIAVVGILPVLIIYPYTQKYFVKGIVLGGVKG